MRTRQAIEIQVSKDIIGPVPSSDDKLDLIMLEVLLDIRELLVKLNTLTPNAGSGGISL